MIDKMLDTKWLAINEFWRIVTLPFLRVRFAMHGVRWGSGWRVFGMPVIQKHRRSSIVLGDGVTLRSTVQSNPLAPNHPIVIATRSAGAIIRVGIDCGFTGATIVAAERIEIGDRVLVGANVVIVDTDFHPLTPEGREADITNGAHSPVIIEDDVFIGMNALILKGVRIGHGSVVGAGSVVVKDVPPQVIVAGNPARIVKHL